MVLFLGLIVLSMNIRADSLPSFKLVDTLVVKPTAGSEGIPCFSSNGITISMSNDNTCQEVKYSPFRDHG